MAKRPLISDTLSRNLKHLMDTTGIKLSEIERRSGITTRMIRYVLTKEHTPSAQVVDDSGRLEKLMENYAASSETGRAFIERVAEREAKYTYDKPA